MIGALFGSMINAMSQSNANATNELIATQNRVAAQNEAQLSRQWQKYMVDYQNQYNSPAAQIARGLNPFVSPTGAGTSASPGPSPQASIPSTPAMQGVHVDLSSIDSALATFAQARKAISESNQVETLTPLLAKKIIGDTNYKNIGVGESGYWDANTGRVSAELDQSRERQELENAVAAGKLSAAQTTHIYLQADAQAVLNKYMDANQQAELLTKCQYLYNLVQQGVLTEAQVRTELKRALLIGAQAEGQTIQNEIASGTADALISATNMAYYTQYYDSLWDYKNVNNRKNIQYSKDKAIRDYYKWSAGNAKKDFDSYGLRNAIDFTSRIFQGAGNIIGAMRPGAQIFRNDYGPRNTTIYNGSNGIGY
nr:MAG TPA: hypothetical protein [Microviridae sp.]